MRLLDLQRPLSSPGLPGLIHGHAVLRPAWHCCSISRTSFEPLESEATGTEVGIGVATGLDKVFITKDPKLVEESRLLPLAMADDTVTGHFRWAGHYLVNPWDSDGLVDLQGFSSSEGVSGEKRGV